MLTPEADKYLEDLHIIEIAETHECKVLKELNTKELMIPVEREEKKRGRTVPIVTEEKSLFDVLCIFKYKLKCNF